MIMIMILLLEILKPFDRCDYGYEGDSCDEATTMRPTVLIETLSSVSSIRSHFEVIVIQPRHYTAHVCWAPFHK